MKQVFIFQHVPNEGAGTLLAYLDASGVPHQTVALYKDDPFPDLGSVAAALVMGGPMNVDEEAKYPFLAEEIVFVRTLAVRDVPTLGVCLGSQLIAKALGRRVYKASTAEVGWRDVVLTAEGRRDPLFSAVPSPTFRVLQWHEDTFDVPDGAVALAMGSEVPNQAFRYGKNVYAFQFHVEADRPMVQDWFAAQGNLDAILAEYDAYHARLQEITKKMYARFFGRIAGARLTEGVCRESR